MADGRGLGNILNFIGNRLDNQESHRNQKELQLMRALTQLDAEDRAREDRLEYDKMVQKIKNDYVLETRKSDREWQSKVTESDRKYQDERDLKSLALELQKIMQLDQYQSGKQTTGYYYKTPTTKEGNILLDEFETGGLLNPFMDKDAYSQGSMFLREVDSQMDDLLKEPTTSTSRQSAVSETKSIFDALNSDKFDTSEEGGRNRNLVKLLGAMLQQLDPSQKTNYNWDKKKEPSTAPNMGSYGSRFR